MNQHVATPKSLLATTVDIGYTITVRTGNKFYYEKQIL